MKIIINPRNYDPYHGITRHRIFDSVEALQKLTLPFDAQRWYIFTAAGVYLYLNHNAATPYTQAAYPLASCQRAPRWSSTTAKRATPATTPPPASTPMIR